ncbi:MAG: hypothetical protein M0Q42_02215 [Xanthomonadales bacterium]|nr:hypothetical protein [Xanthomonadales bacterium]
MNTPNLVQRCVFRLQVIAYRFRQLFRRVQPVDRDSTLVGIHAQDAEGNFLHVLRAMPRKPPAE